MRSISGRQEICSITIPSLSGTIILAGLFQYIQESKYTAVPFSSEAHSTIAIMTECYFHPHHDYCYETRGHHSLSGGAIAGIVLGSLTFVIIITLLFWVLRKQCRDRRIKDPRQQKGHRRRGLRSWFTREAQYSPAIPTYPKHDQGKPIKLGEEQAMAYHT